MTNEPLTLHSTAEWEREQTAAMRFDHFFYAGGQVTKVKGRILRQARRWSGSETGTLTRTAEHRVWWDGAGRCFLQSTGRRLRNFDVPFTQASVS